MNCDFFAEIQDDLKLFSCSTETDAPPSYPQSPAIILHKIDVLKLSGSNQETPPPSYNKWFLNDIFKQALLKE
jgi:hypothetical protein